MNKNFTLLFFCLCFFFIASAQKASLKGIIEDTTANQKLVNSTITLLRTKDSILYKFTRSKDKGFFELKNLDSGKYVLLITYPQYADFADYISLTDTSTLDLGIIAMISKRIF